MYFGIQTASIVKRIAALILDFILLTIIATSGMLLISALTGFDGHTERLENYYNEYASSYGIETLNITETEYNELSQDEKDRYDAAMKALNEDEEVLRTYSVTTNLLLLIPSLGIFFAYAVTEFAVPLILGNGQTVGKKVFNLAVIRCDGIKVSPLMLFVRTLLGKFTVETMIPLMLIVMNGLFATTGLLVAGLIVLLEIILIAATKNRTSIHDAFAQTVVVDLPTQLIFNTPEELLAYKTRAAKEAAAQAEYR